MFMNGRKKHISTTLLMLKIKALKLCYITNDSFISVYDQVCVSSSFSRLNSVNTD